MHSRRRRDTKITRSGGWQRVFVEAKGRDVSHLFYGPAEVQIGRQGRVKVAAIGGVGTDPKHRHQGLAAAVFTRALREMAKEKYSATGLYTSKRLVAHRLYRRFGLVDIWERRPASKLLDPGGFIHRRVSEFVRESREMGGRRMTLQFELSLAQPINVRIEGNEVTILSRSPRQVDVTMELLPQTLLPLLNGQLTLREALASRRLRWEGDPAVFAILSNAMKARQDPVDEE
jgi:putative sterol carrier protein